MPPSSATAFQSLQDFNTSRPSAQNVIDTANTKYDIPGYTSRLSSLRGLVGNLQSSVDAVDPSVSGRTSGSFVTEGQRQALVSKEQAPILGSLSKQQTALGNEQTGLSTAQGLASQMASAMMSQDQQKYQSLLDQYNAAAAAEQEAEKKRQFDATLAEQVAARKAASTAATGGSYDLGSLLGGGNTPATAATQGIEQRADKGFNFLDTAGHGINAYQYAQGHSIPFRTLLQQMASKGDTGAIAGLQFIGNDGNADPTKVTNQNLANLYHALTGRWVAVNGGSASSVAGSSKIPIFTSQMPNLPKIGR